MIATYGCHIEQHSSSFSTALLADVLNNNTYKGETEDRMHKSEEWLYRKLEKRGLIHTDLLFLPSKKSLKPELLL